MPTLSCSPELAESLDCLLLPSAQPKDPEIKLLDTMDQHAPPSPALTKAESLPTGFNELLQHNAAASYPRDAMSVEPIQAHSQPDSRYGTPASQPHHSQGFDTSMSYQQCGGGGELVGRFSNVSRVPGGLTWSLAAGLSSAGGVPA